MSYPIPKAALDQHAIVLGKTRSGKSSKMRLLVEGLLDSGSPVCILDPKGDWWGLKSSADGKKAGYPVIIFGGEHADVPINEHSGAHVAELIATGNRPCIIDLGGWMVGARTRFFIDFASTLFKYTKGKRHLVIDEVHNFAPQGKVIDPEAGKMLHWANRLASEGAGKGLLLLSASQRPQKVHKDFVTSNETLIACRVIHKLDRDAIKDWIDGCADPAMGREVIAALAQLQRSQAYVWSPEIGFGPKLVDFPLFKTYDSFKPQHENAGALKGWASVDLEDVKTRLIAVVEEAKANDPKALKAEIAALKKQLATAPKETVLANKADMDCAHALGRLEGETDGWTSGWQTGWKAGHVKGCKDQMAEVERVALAFTPDAPAAPKAPKGGFTSAKASGFHNLPSQVKPSTQFAPVSRPQEQRQAQPPQHLNGSEASMGAERRPLGALASVHPAGMTEAQWAVAAGLKRKGGTWSTYVSRLRTAARIEKRGDLYFATEQGIADLGGAVTAMPPPGQQLVEFWAGKISGIGPMLRALADTYPQTVSREDLAARLDMAAGGGTFSTYISRLRAPGLIDVSRDGLRASDALMVGL